MEIINVAEGEVVQNLQSPKHDPSIHPSIPYPYSLLKRFYLGSIYVGFGIVTALNMSAMLWNVFLLHTKDHLYLMFMLPNIFDRRFYINTQVQATYSDLQKSTVAQNQTRSTRQLTNLFYGAAAVNKKVE